MKTPSPLAARAVGSYSRGCLAGGRSIAIDGQAWQVMRLSRNRNWGHPDLVRLVERLAGDVQRLDSWPGLLVGDMSQPRGGPMLTGHASHQIGLDADIWLTPMPDRRLTPQEREDLSATSMVAADKISVDAKVWTPGHVRLIKRAASYPEVERILVHPAIKKALCVAVQAEADRAWLGKVRPFWGHEYHMHVRMRCPAGSTTCEPQKPTTGDDGCDKEIADWLALVSKPPPPLPTVPTVPVKPPLPPPPPLTLQQLPAECAIIVAGRGAGKRQPVKRVETVGDQTAGTPMTPQANPK